MNERNERLQPQSGSYRWNPAGFLERMQAGTALPVRVRACLPHQETSPLSVRNAADEEVELLPSLEGLDLLSRDALQRDLAESRFTLRVSRIVSLDSKNEMRVWEVETNLGPRRFVTGLEDWPLPKGAAYVVKDAWGDLYDLPYEEFDERSRKLLWPLLG